MVEKEIVREVEIEKPSEQNHIQPLDKRGRITIPSQVRGRHGVDTTDEDKEIWAEITLHSLEVRDASGGDGSE